jgi:peroxiredoxin
MKKKYFLILACLLFAGCQGKPDATDSNGKSIYLSDYRGKWMVVNYWATWCQPCLTELPALNTLHTAHADTLVVLAVNFDGLSPPEIRNFAQAQHLTLPFLSHFPVEKFGITEIASLPTTFLITPEGKLFKTLYGPQTEKSILKNMEKYSPRI